MNNNKLDNNNNIDIVHDLFCMGPKQIHQFKNYYRDLTNRVTFMEYRNYLPNQFYLITEDYDCFLFYRDDYNDQLICYYDLHNDTIDLDHLLYLYNEYNAIGVLFTNTNYNSIGIEEVQNIEEGEDLDDELIDCIKWLANDLQLEDIELLGCNDYTKNLYKNYFNNKDSKNV